MSIRVAKPVLRHPGSGHVPQVAPVREMRKKKIETRTPQPVSRLTSLAGEHCERE